MNSKILTTGQAARVCGVAPRTVTKWFDKGLLQGWRLPGSKDRRIPRENLVRFLVQHGMPHATLDEVLLAGCADLAGAMAGVLTYSQVDSGFEAGELLPDGMFACLVIDIERIGRVESGQVAIRAREINPAIAVIGLHADQEPPFYQEARFNELFRKPFDAALLVERIKSRLR